MHAISACGAQRLPFTAALWATLDHAEASNLATELRLDAPLAAGGGLGGGSLLDGALGATLSLLCEPSSHAMRRSPRDPSFYRCDAVVAV